MTWLRNTLEANFKPVADGFVFRTPTLWLLGPGEHYLVTEAQKAEILGSLFYGNATEEAQERVIRTIDQIIARLGSEKQIALIRDAVPKRDYYVTGPDGCRKVSLGLSTLELAIAGATSETDVLTVREAYQHHGDRWLTEYLGGLGIDYQTIPGRETAYA